MIDDNVKKNKGLSKKVTEYFENQRKIAKSDFLRKDYDELPKKEGLNLLGFLKIIKRYIIAFASIVAVITIFSFTFGSKYSKTLYYGRGEISFTSAVHGYLYTVVQEDLGTDKTANNVATLLTNDGITHSNGDSITPAEIRSGISS